MHARALVREHVRILPRPLRSSLGVWHRGTGVVQRDASRVEAGWVRGRTESIRFFERDGFAGFFGVGGGEMAPAGGEDG